jgi:hypothetical protein
MNRLVRVRCNVIPPQGANETDVIVHPNVVAATSLGAPMQVSVRGVCFRPRNISGTMLQFEFR